MSVCDGGGGTCPQVGLWVMFTPNIQCALAQHQRKALSCSVHRTGMQTSSNAPMPCILYGLVAFRAGRCGVVTCLGGKDERSRGPGALAQVVFVQSRLWLCRGAVCRRRDSCSQFQAS